jgi:P-type Mg2+ transporter
MAKDRISEAAPREEGDLSSAPWIEPMAQALRRLESRPEGLSALEAQNHLSTFGPNVVAGERRRGAAVQILLKFRNPLILLLLGAATVAGLTGDARSFVVIIVVVVLSVILDFIQEHRAGQAAERLRHATLMRASVMRDRVPCELPAMQVVPGDVVLLSAGDLVPADARLLEARDLFVNQVLLTGEPYPLEKNADASATTSAETALTDAPNAVLMGTSVVSGSARALIVRTGRRTMLGQIGASLQRTPPPSAFERGTRAFGLLILRLALLMVLFVILVNAWRGRPWLDSFLFAIALAVGLAPELLPMIVSVTLSRGALRMSRRKVLVKRLAAIHDLGSMDVLCTDKTGTLTEARIRLERHIDASGRDSPRVLELVYLNSHFQSGLRSPLDDAILEHREVEAAAWSKLDEIPFDFERRRVSVLLRRATEAPLLVVKGAFEDILRVSTRYETDAGETRALDEAARASMTARFEELSREGFRVLGVSSRPLPEDHAVITKAHEVDLTFAGFAAFQDPPKESARTTLRQLAELGIAVKVLTGDNELVAEHVCRELDLPIPGVLTGTELQGMDDLILDQRVDRTTLFCRVTPAQKNRIIVALKRRRHVVGFLGDGINDAPALHASDVGISVDSAVDVAKEAADLILLERDLGVLKDGVLEGRRTLGNIVKYILMGTSSNFGNMFSMAGAVLFLPFLPMLPIQILVNNFLYDLSEIPIPTDDVDEDFLRQPHRWDMTFIRRFMLVIGPVSSVFDFVTFYLLFAVLGAGEALFHTGWFIESLSTQALVILIIRTRGNPLRSRPSPALAITSSLVVVAAIVLPLTPLGAALGFVHLPPVFYPVLAVMVVVYLVAVELVKRAFYRHFQMK